jgi:hypothetical protein
MVGGFHSIEGGNHWFSLAFFLVLSRMVPVALLLVLPFFSVPFPVLDVSCSSKKPENRSGGDSVDPVP